MILKYFSLTRGPRGRFMQKTGFARIPGSNLYPVVLKYDIFNRKWVRLIYIYAKILNSIILI